GLSMSAPLLCARHSCQRVRHSTLCHEKIVSTEGGIRIDHILKPCDTSQGFWLFFQCRSVAARLEDAACPNMAGHEPDASPLGWPRNAVRPAVPACHPAECLCRPVVGPLRHGGCLVLVSGHD